MNRKGVTIIELLIYIVLFTVVSLLIGRQFKGLISNYSSNKRIVRQQTDARGVLGMMIQEIRNTGLKVFLQKSGNIYTRMVASGVTVSPTDLSSFIHTQGDPFDELTILKLQLDNDGNKTIVDRSRYYIAGNTLKREYTPSAGIPTNSVVAENVHALQFQYGVLAANSAVITNEDPFRTPLTSYWESSGSPTPSMPAGASTISLTCAAGNVGYLKYKTQLSVTSNMKYKVTLKITASGGFPQNLNWMQVSFQNSTRDDMYGFEKFKPSSNPMELIVSVYKSSTNGAYLYIDYSANGTGTTTLSGMEIRCSQLGAYSWTYSPTINTNPLTDKINVRAIRIYLLTRTGEKTSVKSTETIPVGEVSVTPSGDYAWRLYTETVETSNNGRF